MERFGFLRKPPERGLGLFLAGSILLGLAKFGIVGFIFLPEGIHQAEEFLLNGYIAFILYARSAIDRS
jgi:hypothetical protein